MSINRGKDKEDVVHIYNGILLSHKKGRSWVICRDVDGPRDCHTIHFELIFVKGVRYVRLFCSFVLFCMFSCSSSICWNDSLGSIALFLLHCQRSYDHVYVGLFLVSLFYPLIYLSILMPIPYCLDYCSFIVSLEVRWCQFSNFVLLKYCVDYSGSFASL